MVPSSSTIAHLLQKLPQLLHKLPQLLQEKEMRPFPRPQHMSQTSWSQQDSLWQLSASSCFSIWTATFPLKVGTLPILNLEMLTTR